jgi:hypothetical protein
MQKFLLETAEAGRGCAAHHAAARAAVPAE